MPRSDQDRLRHMLEAAQKAMALVEGLTLDDLKADEVRALAVTHLLEILGEAAKGVSQQTQAAKPELPWSQMAATRDRLIHGYFAVDLDIIWQIVQDDLPPVVEGLRDLLAEDG